MANLYENIPEMQARAAANEQRRKIAESLLVQSQDQVQPFVNTGRMVAPMSITQGLAQMLKAYYAGKGIKSANEGDKALASEHAAKAAEAIAAYKAQSQGVPERAPAPIMPLNGQGPPKPAAGPPVPEVPKDPRGAMINALASDYLSPGFKQAIQYGDTVRREDAEFASRAQERKDKQAFDAERYARDAQNDRLSIEQRAEAARMHNETMRAIAAGNNAVAMSRNDQPKPPAGFEYDQDGNQRPIKGGPAWLKQEAQRKKEIDAKNVVDSQIDAEIKNIDFLIGKKTTDKAGKPVYTLHPGLNAAVGSMDARFPTVFQGTADAEAAIEALQSQASIQALRDIRAGGSQSVGTITEREWPRLESYKSKLQLKQGDKQYPKSLWEYREELLRTKSDAAKALNEVGGSEVPASPTAPPTFATEAEAAAAGLQPNTKVIIGGVPGTWQ